jgi:hypothetical protein
MGKVQSGQKMMENHILFLKVHNMVDRLTRKGEISPVGRLFSLGSFLLQKQHNLFFHDTT